MKLIRKFPQNLGRIPAAKLKSLLGLDVFIFHHLSKDSFLNLGEGLLISACIWEKNPGWFLCILNLENSRLLPRYDEFLIIWWILTYGGIHQWWILCITNGFPYVIHKWIFLKDSWLSPNIFPEASPSLSPRILSGWCVFHPPQLVTTRTARSHLLGKLAIQNTHECSSRRHSPGFLRSAKPKFWDTDLSNQQKVMSHDNLKNALIFPYLHFAHHLKGFFPFGARQIFRGEMLNFAGVFPEIKLQVQLEASHFPLNHDGARKSFGKQNQVSFQTSQ